MFTTKTESGETKFTTLSKVIGIITGILTICGAVLFMDDRYLHVADAIAKDKAKEAEAVKTFQMQQEVFSMQQKILEKDFDRRALEDARDHKVFLQRELQRNPNDPQLLERLERVNKRLEVLEKKLYQ